MQLLRDCVCISCKHLRTNMVNAFCKAFPNGIPDEIIFGISDHKKPLKDQKNDIVFEQVEDKK